MQAVIDVGSNTVRMLIGDCHKGTLVPYSYHREIVRLAGEFSPQTGLSAASMTRATAVLKSFKKIISTQDISPVRVIGTAALRRAANRQVFIDTVSAETGFRLEVIDGEEEALLTARGVLSVVDSADDAAIIFDIGGGSTEFICLIDGKIRFQQSYPLGVVRLCEEFPSATAGQKAINSMVNDFFSHLDAPDLADYPCRLIGTAGTVTTLAAIDLGLAHYIPEKVNNHDLSIEWLISLKQKLEGMTVAEREQLAGMEQGRGDLILPGLEIVLAILEKQKLTSLTVADAGLLEGVFLGFCSD